VTNFSTGWNSSLGGDAGIRGNWAHSIEIGELYSCGDLGVNGVKGVLVCDIASPAPFPLDVVLVAGVFRVVGGILFMVVMCCALCFFSLMLSCMALLELVLISLVTVVVRELMFALEFKLFVIAPD